MFPKKNVKHEGFHFRAIKIDRVSTYFYKRRITQKSQIKIAKG